MPALHRGRRGLRSGIVVVDNASSDETRGVLSRDFPDVTVVPSAATIGFAAACNLGMAPRRPSAPAYYLFVNPERMWSSLPGALVDAMEADHAAAWRARSS